MIYQYSCFYLQSMTVLRNYLSYQEFIHFLQPHLLLASLLISFSDLTVSPCLPLSSLLPILCQQICFLYRFNFASCLYWFVSISPFLLSNSIFDLCLYWFGSHQNIWILSISVQRFQCILFSRYSLLVFGRLVLFLFCMNTFDYYVMC